MRLSIDEENLSVLFDRENRDVRFVVGCFLEINYTVNESEKGVILTHADILSRVVLCTTLTYDDIACNDMLATENFDSESFAMRLATILRTTYTFFMCHDSICLKGYATISLMVTDVY